MNITIPNVNGSGPPAFHGPVDRAHAFLDPGQYHVAEHPDHLLIVTSTDATLMQPVTAPARPVAPGREFDTLVTVATAEAIATKAHTILRRSPAITATATGRLVSAFLQALITETTNRTQAEVKIPSDADAIEGAAAAVLRRIREALPEPSHGLIEFRHLPDGYEASASGGHRQVSFRTPAGPAVITALDDGTYEIETSFTGGQTRLYNDTLSPAATLARLIVLATVHQERHA